MKTTERSGVQDTGAAVSGSPVKSKARDRLRLAPSAVQLCATPLKNNSTLHIAALAWRVPCSQGWNEHHLTCGGLCGGSR
jgi:hypothetical protein